MRQVSSSSRPCLPGRLRLHRLLAAVLLSLLPVAALLAAGASAAEAASSPRLTARTLGPVHSPVLPYLERALRGTISRVRPVSGTSSPVAITIIDGDPTRGRRLAGIERVRRELDAGNWILALDATNEDRRAIQQLTGFWSGPGYAAAVLFRRTGADDEQVRIVESPVVRPRSAVRNPRQEADWTAEMLADELRAWARSGGRSGARASAGATARASAANAAIPPELLHVQWSYTTRGSGRSGVAYNGKGDQTANWLVNYTYDAYLDNKGQRPQGSFQWVTVDVDGSFSPKLAEERFSRMEWDSYGFWTGAASMNVGPVAGDQSALNLFQSKPETQNTETEYSSGSSFSVGFKGSAEASGRGPGAGAGLDLSYGVEQSRSWKVTDWAVRGTADPNLARAAWRFSARNPCDFRDGVPSRNNNCFDTWYRGPGEPNELSKGNLPFHASAVWRTDAVLRRPVSFSTGLEFSLVNTYSDYCSVVVCFDQSWRMKRIAPAPGRHELNLGAVVPVGIGSLEFTPGTRVLAGTQVAAGTPVKGRLTLAAPAPMDLTIPLFSSTPNATVDANLRIPKGATSGEFQILTNTNGMARGQELTATISAFYAEPTREQLVLVRPE